MRVGQQRVAQGNRDEVAEFGQRRGFGARKQLSAVSFGRAEHIGGPEPLQHIGDVAAHVQPDPVRTGFQPPSERGAQLRHLRLQRALAHRPVTVEPCVQITQVEPVRVEREQPEDLHLPPGEPQPHAVELRAGLAEQLKLQQPAAGTWTVACGYRRDACSHFPCQQPGQRLGRSQADRVGAIPGRGQVEHAELAPGARVVHRGGPAHPAVHAAGEVLRGVHGGRMVQPERQVQRVRPDAGLIPPASGNEVHLLRPVPHDRAAVGPHDPGGRIGDRHDELAIVGRRLQLGFELPDGAAERARLPGEPGLVGVCQRRLVDLGHDVRGRALPARDDLGSHACALGVRPPLVADRRNVLIPRLREKRAPPVQLGASVHHQPQGSGLARPWFSEHAALSTGRGRWS